MDSDLVSIIIPHYNRAEIIKQTLDSVYQQTYAKWEIIVVDDNSDDEQFNLLYKTIVHPQVLIISRRGSVKGPSTCRNQGARVAKGKYLLFLDSDDLLAPFCLANRVSAMDKFPELSFGVFLMEEFQCFPNDTNRIYNLIYLENNLHICSFLKNINPWNVTCPIWNRESFLALGGFDVNFIYMEDPELHVRALLNGSITYKTFYDQPADSYYRINHHDSTKTAFYENSIKYRILFYKKVWNLIQSTPMPTELLDKYKLNIKVGLFNTLNNFLLSKISECIAFYDDMYLWAKEYNVLSARELLALRILKYIWLKDSRLFTTLRLKGLSRKFLLFRFT